MNRELTPEEVDYLSILAENGAGGYKTYKQSHSVLSRLEREGLVLSIKNADHTLYRITKKGMHKLHEVQS